MAFNGELFLSLSLLIVAASPAAFAEHLSLTHDVQEHQNTTAEIKVCIEHFLKGIDQLKAANTELQKRVNALEQLHHVSKSCADLYKSGVRTDGVYTINPDGLGAFNVSCDMTTSGGGWTVFQRRIDGSIDFYLGWNEYKKGFGDLTGEFWLGLDNINRLSTSGQNHLRVDLEDFENETRCANYSTFGVANETDKYELTIDGYSGNAGDSLARQNGMKFSTKDADNDLYSTSACATLYKGAWWYKNCHDSNLNGLYLGGPQTSRADGVNWKHWKGYYYSLKKTEMKIRPRSF